MERPPQFDGYGYNARPEVAPFLPRSARRVLDVGPAEGGFGETLRRTLGTDAHLTAIDALADHVASIRATGHYDDVVHGYFPADLPPGPSYDLITFLDVLEHMTDPWTAVAAAFDRLVGGGLVVASIPNVAYWPVVRGLLGGRWDYQDMGVLDRTHLRFFTKATMSEMFERAGYEVLEVNGINSFTAGRSRRMAYRAVRRIVPNVDWQQFVVVARRP